MPVMSVITNISKDHMAFLEDRLEMIAAEKAGIIKPGIPAVIGERQEETDTVFIAKAAKPVHRYFLQKITSSWIRL